MIRKPDRDRAACAARQSTESKHRVLSFKPQLRLEWRGQDGQNETEARSFRQLRRFHHVINSDEVFGTHSTLYHYPNPYNHQKLAIAAWPAAPNIAQQIYTQATMPKMCLRYSRGETMEKTLAWAEGECEGFMRG